MTSAPAAAPVSPRSAPAPQILPACSAMCRTMRSCKAGGRCWLGCLAARGGDAPLALRILIVEDNAVNRAVITDQMVQLGHHPTTAEIGFVALDRLANERSDLVPMNMQMPGISGPDITRRLRGTSNALPVIGVTANATTEDRRICQAAGMTGFLAKPVTPDRLAGAIAEAMSGGHASCARANAERPVAGSAGKSWGIAGGRVAGPVQASLPE